jgi:hypothetical protein
MTRSALLLALLAAGRCQAEDQTITQLRATPCINWEENKDAFEEARAEWSAPPCYDFSYTFRGFQVGLPEAKAVQVRNGVISGDGDKSINDFFDMIETNCVTSCPTAGASKCVHKYAGDGHPLSIFIDMSQYRVGEELTYGISDYSVVDCAATTSGAVDGGVGQIQSQGEQDQGRGYTSVNVDGGEDNGGSSETTAAGSNGETEVLGGLKSLVNSAAADRR